MNEKTVCEPESDSTITPAELYSYLPNVTDGAFEATWSEGVPEFENFYEETYDLRKQSEV